MDLIAGNWGPNGTERASSQQPLRLYYGDFMDRGTVDLIETEYDAGGTEPMPARRLSEIASALPAFRERFTSHRAWAHSSVHTILSSKRNGEEIYTSTPDTTVFRNQRDREQNPLPATWDEP